MHALSVCTPAHTCLFIAGIIKQTSIEITGECLSGPPLDIYSMYLVVMQQQVSSILTGSPILVALCQNALTDNEIILLRANAKT